MRNSIILFFIAVCFCKVAHGMNDNTMTLLDRRIIYQCDALKNAPCGISYIFFDLKDDGTSLKICEAGPAPCAGMPMSSVIVNGIEERMHAPYWELFWQFVARSHVPFWYVGKNPHMEPHAFASLGGKVMKSWQALEGDSYFQSVVSQQVRSGASIETMVGIVVCQHSPVSDRAQAFKKKFPSIIIVNEYVHDIVANKDKCNEVFKLPALAKFKPLWGIYKKQYSPFLADTILHDLQSDYVVIKPLSAHQSSGVIMTARRGFDDLLKRILCDQYLLKTAPHRSMKYWLKDKKDFFIAESYAPSKPISVDGRLYDPTVRLVVFLAHEHDCVTAHIVAGFVKIPLKGLNEFCPLTEKHITIPLSGAKYVGRAIQPDEMNRMRDQLGVMLREFYPAAILKSLGSVKTPLPA